MVLPLDLLIVGVHASAVVMDGGSWSTLFQFMCIHHSKQLWLLWLQSMGRNQCGMCVHAMASVCCKQIPGRGSSFAIT